MYKNFIILLILGILFVNFTYADKSFDVVVNITAIPNNVTLIYPPNGQVWKETSFLEINFKYNSTNIYNETQNYLIYLDGNLIGNTNQTNFTKVVGKGRHFWYVVVNSTLGSSRSATWSFVLQDEICTPDAQPICSIGAGLAIFINHISIPLAYFLIFIIIVSIIYIIGKAIAERIKEE